MVRTEQIQGHEVNVTYDKAGKLPQFATVLVGSADHPGMRLKEGAADERRHIREEIADALGLPLARVSASARYHRLKEREDGLIQDDKTGGVCLP